VRARTAGGCRRTRQPAAAWPVRGPHWSAPVQCRNAGIAHARTAHGNGARGSCIDDMSLAQSWTWAALKHTASRYFQQEQERLRRKGEDTYTQGCLHRVLVHRRLATLDLHHRPQQSLRRDQHERRAATHRSHPVACEENETVLAFFALATADGYAQ
jgi:hypothetical protein